MEFTNASKSPFYFPRLLRYIKNREDTSKRNSVPVFFSKRFLFATWKRGCFVCYVILCQILVGKSLLCVLCKLCLKTINIQSCHCNRWSSNVENVFEVKICVHRLFFGRTVHEEMCWRDDSLVSDTFTF